MKESGSTHHIDVTFQMEEMDGSPDCSAEILFDLYISDLVTIVKSSAYEAKFTTMKKKKKDLSKEALLAAEGAG
jgi:hypothetical protein